jgi:hypothetical protein
MKTYVVYYSSWDTMEIYYVGQYWERAYEMVKYNADVYGEGVTYLQTWVDGLLLSDQNAKEVLVNELG